ncbi:class I SAM-dependent methyltransferase [Flavisolibacter sp. BT320]|nr:class I SAM-dependent methyltransferase [Flavisolibacter longurius]
MIRSVFPSAFKKKVRQFVKGSLHFREYSDFLQEERAERAAVDGRIPRYNLEQRHIRNLEVLTDREALLHRMTKDGTVSELGVNRGGFSQRIIDIAEPAKLHLIDAWGNPERYHDGLKLEVAEKFGAEIEGGRIEVNVGYSTEVLKQFPDHYFDWVYLDTDHSYIVTAAELAILKLKVKPYGIIAGHDYSIGNWVGNVRYGVIEAVHEFCVKEDWELVYVTINVAESPSFAIRKIKKEEE